MTRTQPTTAEWRAAGRIEDIGGRRIFVIDSAPGDSSRPAIFLIHGFPTASWDWCRLWPMLTPDYRLTACDLLGFGFSAKPRGHRYRIAEQADIVERVAARAGLSAFHLLAHDYGDTVVQELLARDCDRQPGGRSLKSACLLNGGLFPETHRARPVQKLLAGPLGPIVARFLGRAAMERSMRAIFGARTQPDAEEFDAFWQLMTHAEGVRAVPALLGYMAERRRHRERWVGALQASPVPLALIAGAADPVSGAHMVARYREVVGAESVIELAGIGHYPQLEAAADVGRHYLAFLSACA